MKLRFPESKIQYWAERYEPQSTETQFVKLIPKVQKRGYLTKNELMRVAHWKSPRPIRHVEKNDPDYIRDITSCAFTAKSERARVSVLTCLEGVAMPTASAILHLISQRSVSDLRLSRGIVYRGGKLRLFVFFLVGLCVFLQSTCRSK